MEKTPKKNDVSNFPSHTKLPRTVGQNNDTRRNNFLDVESKKNKKATKRRSNCQIKRIVVFANNKLKIKFNSLKTNKMLYKFIKRAIHDLENDSFCGIKIKKKLWPKFYIRKHQITNLWKYDLPNGWRLIYTIETDEIAILSIILEYLDHKNYERRFKY
jgi:Txe/YoeB family toxin of Txe-Axe toxin-antitoxin module